MKPLIGGSRKDFFIIDITDNHYFERVARCRWCSEHKSTGRYAYLVSSFGKNDHRFAIHLELAEDAILFKLKFGIT